MPLVIPLAVWIAALLLLGLALTVRVWAKAMLHVFAAGRGGGILKIITLPVRLLERVVMPGLNYVTHELTKAASHYMHPLAQWFDHLADLTVANAVAVGLFAERTAIGFERLTTVVLPREIGKAVRPVNRKALAALGLAGLTAEALKRFARGIDRLLHEKVIPQVRHLTHAVEHAIPGELGRIRTRIGQVETQLSKPTRVWLRRLAAALWAAGLLGFVVKVLARRFPWLFCRKVSSVGRRLCGLDSDLLSSLIADTLILAGIISVVEFAKSVNGFMVITTPAIKGFLRETSGLVAEDYLS